MQPIPEEDNQAELQRRAHADLTNRARGGIVIYLLGWLILTLPTGIHREHSTFFILNLCILLLIMASRLLHFYCFKTRPRLNVGPARNWLVWTTLTGALHWGLMSAWVLTHGDFQRLDFYLIVSAAVLGIAGTTALSIAREIRLLFPLFILTPIVLALFWRGTADDLILASMAMLAMGYVAITANTASEDYWKAVATQSMAEQHALEMENLSVTDHLTRLKNRSYFDRCFNEEWKRSNRQRSPLSVLMLDLDCFKALNDHYGHVFGDAVLQQVAQVLQHEVYRESDLIARYGGEEFVVLLPDTDAQAASLVAERLRAAVFAIEMSYEGEPVRPSCSIGGATVLADYRVKPELLLKQADAALYQAKGQGRNRYQAAPALLPGGSAYGAQAG